MKETRENGKTKDLGLCYILRKEAIKKLCGFPLHTRAHTHARTHAHTRACAHTHTHTHSHTSASLSESELDPDPLDWSTGTEGLQRLAEAVCRARESWRGQEVKQ